MMYPFGSKKSSKSPKEAKNSLRSNSVGRIVDVISEGPIRGLVDGLKSVYMDDTPILSADGKTNFEGAEIEFREGYPDQDPIPGFAEIESEVAVNTVVEQATPVVRTVSNSNLDAIRVTIRLNAMYAVQKDGDIVPTTVKLQIAVKASGGSYVTVKEDTISGKTNAPYERSYRITLPAGGAPWDVKVTRITADSTDSKLVNQFSWVRYTEVIDHRVNYSDSAVAGVAVDASLFGDSIPSRGYEVYGLMVNIPSNYDPDARTYTGEWDGTFVVDWTNNPAWVLYAIVTNERWGLGQWMPPELIDKWALYEIAQYCDGLVDDGLGGVEPRFTFNGVIDSQEEAFKVMQFIASSFRGMLFWGNNALVAVQDSPKDPVILVTAANVIDGDFNYSGSGLKSRHSVVLVTWNDPNDSYRQTIEVVEDPDLIAKLGWKPIEVQAPGCTSRGQAHRHGRWTLYTEKYESEMISYRASFDHMIADGTAVTPGDIIRVADPAYAGIRYGGRLVSVNSLVSVNLDQTVELADGQTYTLYVVLGDGTVASSQVSNDPGTYDVITLKTDLPVAPVENAIWAISGSDIATRKFRVMAVTEDEDHIVSVTALAHEDGKYDLIEQGIVLEETNYTRLSNARVSPPTDLAYEEYLYQVAGTIKSGLLLSWMAPQGDGRVVGYDVAMKQANDEWRQYTYTINQSVEITDTRAGVWSFRVRAVDGIGNVSDWFAINDKELLGGGTIPDDVTNFKLQVVSDVAHLSWDPVITDLATSHFVIKHQASTTGAAWGSGTVIVERVPRSASGITVPLVVGTYMIKAETLNAKQSVNMASGVYDGTNINAFNAVEIVTEDPSFAGDKTNCEVSGLLLRISPQATDVYYEEAMYYFANVLDLGSVFTSRVTTDILASGVITNNTMDTWSSLAALESLSGSTSSAWGVLVELAMTEDDPDGVVTRSSSGSYVNAVGKIKTVGNDVARPNHDPENLDAGPTLLAEAAATNLLTYSEDLTQAAWVKTRSSIGSNFAVAPDDTTTADKIIEDTTATATHFAHAQGTVNLGVTNTFSVFLKAGSRSHAIVRLEEAAANANNVRVTVNLTTGAIISVVNAGVSTGAAATVKAYPNGWYKVTISGVLRAAGGSAAANANVTLHDGTTSSYTGDGSSYLLVWGAQLEAGSAATSYIKATGSTATRAAETVVSNVTWSPWRPLVVSDYTARGFKFRAKLTTAYPAMTTSVSRLRVTVDMPDRVDGQNNVSIPSVGTTINFDAAFNAVPAVTVTIMNALPNDQLIVNTVTTTSFFVQVKNGGSGAARTVNWVAAGYGRQSV
jgi:predicted phage tail protein